MNPLSPERDSGGRGHSRLFAGSAAIQRIRGLSAHNSQSQVRRSQAQGFSRTGARRGDDCPRALAIIKSAGEAMRKLMIALFMLLLLVFTNGCVYVLDLATRVVPAKGPTAEEIMQAQAEK